MAVDRSVNTSRISAENSRIRKIDQTGTITTIAGNGQFGYSGDGGPAIEATLLGFIGLAVDLMGTINFSDTTHHRIPKVDAWGIISCLRECLGDPANVRISP